MVNVYPPAPDMTRTLANLLRDSGRLILEVVDVAGSVITIESSHGAQYIVTVQSTFQDTAEGPLPNPHVEIVDSGGYLPCGCHGSADDHDCKMMADEPDFDDNDDEVRFDDPVSYDGGYGNGSYYQRAMYRND